MAQLLKQSTAYTFQLGPFVDSTDGVTPETSLTIAATDVDLSKNGGAFADKTDATALTSTGDAQGYYDCVLDTTDTGTLGKLDVRCYVSGALPVFKSFMVVPAIIYDSLVAGSDLLDVSMTQILGTAVSTPATAGILDINLKNIANSAVSATSAQLGVNVVQLSGDGTAADNAESFFDGTGYAGTNNVIPTVTSITNPVTLANGAHGGASASLNLGAGATISKADGHALTLTGGTNGHGLLASGAGTGSGLVGSGGSGGGHGMYVVGDDAGMGIYAVGGDSALGLTAGLFLTSGASSNPVGLYVEDGAIITDNFGTALQISSTGNDGDGVTITGNGTGGDLVADITGNLSGSVGSVSGHTNQTADVATLITTVGVAGAGLTALATQTSVNDVPTVAEFEARTLPSADYVVVGDTLAAVTTVGSVTNVVSANVTQWLGSAAATPTVAGVPEVDITHVSGVVTTATLDSLSSQISAIGSGTGAALNFAASDDNADGTVSGVTLAAVGTPTGTFSNTSADDASTHIIASADVAGTQTITWAYGFNCGVARSASKVTWKGTLSGTGPAPDTFTFAAWNGSTWDTRLVVANSVATVQTFDIPLLSTHTTTTGLVIIRITFAEADAGTLTTNLLLVQAQQSGSLVGYSDGAIWINTNASNTNTVPYIDGVADNPVSTIAAALTLSAALGLKRFRIANSSSITLGAAVDAYSLIGQNWSLALGGQSISGSYIEGASITGTGTGANPPEFFNCHFVGAASAPTVPPCTLLKCGINTTETYPFTAGSAGQFLIVDCFSEVEGSGTPYFSFPGACKINIRRWAGGTNVTLNNSAANMTIEVLAGGGQTIALGGADAEIRGICRAVSLTGVTTDSKVQINAVTGPISIAGADGEVNIYGVCGVVTDNRTGTKGGTNSAISLVNVNAEVDSALNTAIPGSPTADSINERIVALDTGVNITRVNNLLIDGAGTELDPWGPAPT